MRGTFMPAVKDRGVPSPHLNVPGRRKLGIAGISPFVNWNRIFAPYRSGHTSFFNSGLPP
jgi:hypothetical protein